MSADNGASLIRHPKGGFAIIYWIGDYWPDEGRINDLPQFDTIEDAVQSFNDRTKNGEYFEYGLSIRI